MARRYVAQAAAGTWVLCTLAAPALLLWRAGAEGSIGDLRELELLWTGLVIAVCAAIVAALLMGRAVDLAEGDPAIGDLDPWAALFVGSAILAVVVVLAPAATFIVLQPDEDSSVAEQTRRVAAVWVVGALAAAGLGLVAARAVLRRGPRSAARRGA